MGKKKHHAKRRNQNQDRRSDSNRNDRNAQGDQSPRIGYADIVKENAAFEKYYKMQGIVPPEEWEEFMSTLKEGLPVAFRVTGYRSQAKALLKIIQGEYFQELLNVKIEGESVQKPQCLTWYPDNLAWQLKLSRVIIRKSEAFSKLHSFLVSETEGGNISRQETVSMIPPLVLDVQPHHKVLDLCAAPGSKTAQLIEMLHKDEGKIPDGVVVANDVDNKRCYMLVHQAKRLDSPCFIITNHDAGNMPNLKIRKDGEVTDLKFDRILCDVPCSGDGTIRKNVDVWTKWNPANGNNMYGLQLRIAKRGLELLKKGGRMVYSTCSLNPMEDEAVICTLLQESKGSLELLDVSSSLPGLKWLPGVTTWKAMSRDLEVYEKAEEVPEKFKTQIRPQMFPPSPDIVKDLHLERCMRILPHHQDTGGFFVAVFQKNTETLPWEVVSEKNQKQGSKNEGDTRTSSPPRKKQRMQGYKEDPFIFLEENAQPWPKMKEFYQLSSSFPQTQLLSRCTKGSTRNLYFVSETAKNFMQENLERIKIINTGVRLFCRSDNKDANCDFRITHEGLPTILPFLGGRKLNVTIEDLQVLLSDEFSPVERFSELVRNQLPNIASGCVAFCCKEKQGDDEFRMELCGWKGKASLRVYVPKNERAHYLRLCGGDVSIFETKNKKFKAKFGEAAPNNEDKEVNPSSDNHANAVNAENPSTETEAKNGET